MIMNRFNKIVKVPNRLFSSNWGGHFLSKTRKLFAAFLTKLIRWYYHCDIPYTLDVSGIYFCHHGFGVVINPRAVIGKHVVIQHSVTIGEIGEATPVIGDNVYVGAKSTIIGAVKIGDNAKIGAGALVLQDVPAGCTAVGVPARIIKSKNGEETTETDTN